MNAVSGIIFVAVLLGIVGLPRRGVLVAMVVGTLYLGMGAGLDVAGFNVFPARFFGYVCFFRVLFKREFSFSEITKTDKALLVLYLFTTTVLLFRGESFPLRVAKMLDVVFTYFAFRGLIRTPAEFKSLLGVFALLLIPYVAVLGIERFTKINLFALVGVPQRIWLREGTPRCFGSFGHPSLLGSIGACFFPLFAALYFDPEWRKRAILGMGLCVVIVLFSNSGGPVSVLAMAFVGLVLWPMRQKMQLFRRGLVAVIIALAMVMKAPIWYIPAKASSITGGTGWHRSYLMDIAFQNLDQWWLIGLPVKGTAGWMPYGLAATGGSDITNQFLAFGLNAGILAIAMFIFVLYRAFSRLGHALASVRQTNQARSDEWLLWGLGVMLTAHISNWLGITYFDQFYVLWLLEFAAMVSLSEFYLRRGAEIRNAKATQEDEGSDSNESPLPSVCSDLKQDGSPA